MNRLKDKVAVITGASSGIGKAIALGLVVQGVSLRLIGRDMRKLGAVASMAKGKITDVRSYKVDLSLEEEIYQFVESMKSDSGHINVLIHVPEIFPWD
jgi:short-subunit dehydrogenase